MVKNDGLKEAEAANKTIRGFAGLIGVVAATGIISEVLDKMFGKESDAGLKLVVQAMMEFFDNKVSGLEKDLKEAKDDLVLQQEECDRIEEQKNESYDRVDELVDEVRKLKAEKKFKPKKVGKSVKPKGKR